MNTLSRGGITDRVIAELLQEGFPVGDNSSPEQAHGWQGEPDSDTSFIPYMSVTPLNAQPQRNQSFSNSQTEWALPYTIWFAGVSRKQTEALADRMREKLCNIPRTVIQTTTGGWKIQQIRCSAIGSNNRVGSAYPDYYTQADTFEVWVSKEN